MLGPRARILDHYPEKIYNETRKQMTYNITSGLMFISL